MTTLTIKERIRGIFLGTGVGDALGMAVETFSPDKIKEKYGVDRVTDYLLPTGHKWFDGRKAGTTTDDTSLTIAVTEGLIEGGFNMDIQVEKHIEAYKISTSGWGGTTKTAIRNLINGTHWQASGMRYGKYGRGNGVTMKIAPVVAYMRGLVEKSPDQKSKILGEGFAFIRNLTLMTHRTQMAVCASVAYCVALYKCLDPNLDINLLPGYILSFANTAKKWYDGEETDDIVKRFALLKKHNQYDSTRIMEEFGGGSCYCYNSVPFTMMFFLNGPRDINTLYDVVSCGADSDTNGAMLGAMLGALNGEGIFPRHLIDGLDGKDCILETADRLCDAIVV